MTSLPAPPLPAAVGGARVSSLEELRLKVKKPCGCEGRGRKSAGAEPEVNQGRGLVEVSQGAGPEVSQGAGL